MVILITVSLWNHKIINSTFVKCPKSFSLLNLSRSRVLSAPRPNIHRAADQSSTFNLIFWDSEQAGAITRSRSQNGRPINTKTVISLGHLEGCSGYFDHPGFFPGFWALYDKNIPRISISRYYNKLLSPIIIKIPSQHPKNIRWTLLERAHDQNSNFLQVSPRSGYLGLTNRF